MNMKSLKIINILSLSVFYFYVHTQEPVNLTLAKQDVELYYESSSFDQEVKKVLEQAWLQLKNIVPTDKSTIIIDIDETALSNYEYFKLMGLAKGNQTTFTYWKGLGYCRAIKPTLSFYKKLIKKGFKVVFISCRSIEIYDQTAANLKKAGYHTFERIILRTQDDLKVPFYTYKKQKRYELVNEGYEIVACVGDQWSDLEGEHTGIKVKLPNYISYE